MRLEVIVELGFVGRNPWELPAHSFLKGFDFGNRRPGNSGKGDVALRQMHKCAVRVIHVEGATGAALLPLRAKHEVIHDQLASAVEEVG